MNGNFEIAIDDLSAFLSNFGTASGATRETGDCDSDGDVDIQDLSNLLATFGLDVCPLTCAPSPSTGSVTISIDGFDTGFYASGTFSGEVDDFVFDSIITINNTADDWTGSGVRATTANGATFVLVLDPNVPPVPGSAAPGKYATFFSVPYSVNVNSRFNTPFPSGGIAGEYVPSTTAYTYTSSVIDASWYDFTGSSNDGPAAVMRLVISVKDVTGADVSGGFGSVYFTTGSPGSGDIKVADMEFDLTHKYADSGSSIVTGAFYVMD